MSYKLNKNRLEEVNIKDYVNWVGSLLGIWWVLAVASLVVSCVIGLTGTVLAVVLVAIALSLWAKAGNKDKLKWLFEYTVGHVKNWWTQRPKLMDS